jgi:hypothetical protein
MLRVIESYETKYDLQPLDGYTPSEIVRMLQNNEAQTLTDPLTAEKGVYIPTPRQSPGVKKIALLRPMVKGRERVVSYGCD